VRRTVLETVAHLAPRFTGSADERKPERSSGVYSSVMDRDPQADLLQALDEAISILATVGEQHWHSWLEHDRDRVANGDAYGLEHLLAAFGGMGSFNDLVLSPANGHAGTDEELRVMDDRLYSLRDQIWTDCRSLQRELQ